MRKPASSWSARAGCRSSARPNARADHDRAQLLAGGGEVVLGAARAGAPLDHADLLELAQALREQRRRHPRHAAADIVEAACCRTAARAPRAASSGRRALPRRAPPCRTGRNRSCARCFASRPTLQYRKWTSGRATRRSWLHDALAPSRKGDLHGETARNLRTRARSSSRRRARQWQEQPRRGTAGGRCIGGWLHDATTMMMACARPPGVRVLDVAAGAGEQTSPRPRGASARAATCWRPTSRRLSSSARRPTRRRRSANSKPANSTARRSPTARRHRSTRRFVGWGSSTFPTSSVRTCRHPARAAPGGRFAAVCTPHPSTTRSSPSPYASSATAQACHRRCRGSPVHFRSAARACSLTRCRGGIPRRRGARRSRRPCGWPAPPSAFASSASRSVRCTR